MTTATATKTFTESEVATMGIEDFQKNVAKGEMTAGQVLGILDARIAKRKAAGKNQIARIVAYRNELAEIVAKASGVGISPLPMPSFSKLPPANAALPTDPVELADTVFATVGAANAAALIQRLTARIVAA